MGFVMFIWLLFAISLASPWAAIVYLPDSYGWDYDYTLKFSYYVQKVEMVIELSTILFSAVFYIFVIIALYRTRKRFLAHSNSTAEKKILIQAFVITAYCTVLNFLWHNSQALLPASIWTNLTLNMMWILNSGVYPLIYFIVNKAIRDRISAKKSTIPTVSVFTRPHHSKYGSSREAVADAETVSNCKIIRKHFNGDATIGNAIKSNPKVQFLS
ncbi:hypothetical protein ANCCEY_10217 [Ancylostoma ceylanicum]|uniref:7TM GPCR serpentine receptor class x (Srx) domain-containing protein n=2 Tax=Ancylostoma ceylanicum TaxID=53326 RepID=A0A0D6LHN7_9BILA|nr:hypothetical protein ANCCEY_10217 [Ancylostoma ceylanicum]EYC01009.1 hypothetical protein Y032_0111g246 [Ancylostoma ceylanicum]